MAYRILVDHMLEGPSSPGPGDVVVARIDVVLMNDVTALLVEKVLRERELRSLLIVGRGWV